MTYAQRVQQLEGEGLSTSDAQGVADAEQLKGRRFDFDAEHPADTMREPPKAGCIADLDRIIGELPTARAGLTVAQWSDGEPIHIVGLFKGKGCSMFGPAYGIRWECPARRGLFGRGIALYARPLPAWAQSLPRVK